MKNYKKTYVFAIIGITSFLATGCSLSNPKVSNEIISVDKNQGAVETDVNLDLSDRNLENLDIEIFERSELESLNISNNNLSDALPSQIGNLKNLKVLIASNNNFTGVPAELGQLTELEVLDFSNNSLTGLPNELGNLKNLKTFNISGNEFSQQDLNLIREKLPNTEFIIE